MGRRQGGKGRGGKKGGNRSGAGGGADQERFEPPAPTGGRPTRLRPPPSTGSKRVISTSAKGQAAAAVDQLSIAEIVKNVAKREVPKPTKPRRPNKNKRRSGGGAAATDADGIPPQDDDESLPGSFAELGLMKALLDAVKDEGYVTPTPIQGKAIPDVLAGRDVLGVAQTGTGKTAAFTLPIIQRMEESAPSTGSARGNSRRSIRTLVLSPTRELASQINERATAYASYLNLRTAVIFGGVKQNAQTRALREGLDILVACPGRLLDLHNQGHVDLSHVEFFILDEADRMLDMGFLPDVRRVIAQLPTQRQTLLFSATMPRVIVDLSKKLLIDPVTVYATPKQTTVERVTQELLLVPGNASKQRHLLAALEERQPVRAIVFSRTKHGANKIAKQVNANSAFTAMAIHGNKSQSAREQALSSFKSGETRVLVATDVAARGLDVPEVDLVIQYDLPNESESYVHRIGRTARAGREGAALSFCAPAEVPHLKDIERLTGEKIPVIGILKRHEPAAVKEAVRAEKARKRERQQAGKRFRANKRGGGGRGKGAKRKGGRGGGRAPKRQKR